jgi:hypothetical protein
MNQAQTLQQVVMQSNAVIDEGLAKIKLSTSLEDKRSVANLNGDVVRSRTTALHAEKLLLGMTRTDNYSAAAALIMDTAVRIDTAVTAHTAWRVAVDRAELLVSASTLEESSPEYRSLYDEQVAEVAVDYRIFELAVRRAVDLMPAGAAEELTK